MADQADPPRNPEDPEKAKKPGQDKSEGWLSDLARRSSGLPADETPVRKDAEGDKKLWSLAGLGIQFAVTIGLFAFIGYELDKRMNWSPWGLITLSVIAIVGNLYLLIKESLKEDRTPTKRK